MAFKGDEWKLIFNIDVKKNHDFFSQKIITPKNNNYALTYQNF